MCAIAGVLGDARAAELVRKMTDAQKHRGPDGEGFYRDDCIALGQTRLAILDLSAAADQPMTTSCGRWTIVFNGEIFNYVELARELGGEFRSSGDTEVLLRACATWGVEETLRR